MQGLAQKSVQQNDPLNLMESELSNVLRHALTDVSLADMPQQSHTSRQQPGVLHKYVKKWNERFRRRLKIPTETLEPYNAFDGDPSDADHFASKDGTLLMTSIIRLR